MNLGVRRQPGSLPHDVLILRRTDVSPFRAAEVVKDQRLNEEQDDVQADCTDDQQEYGIDKPADSRRVIQPDEPPSEPEMEHRQKGPVGL